MRAVLMPRAKKPKRGRPRGQVLATVPLVTRIEPATAACLRVASEYLGRPIAALVREYLRDGIAAECNSDEDLRRELGRRRIW